MTDHWADFIHLFNTERTLQFTRALALIVIGFMVAKVVSYYAHRFANRFFEQQIAILIKRGSYYLLLAIFLLTALVEMGFNLSVLLGAAGIFSVAIGFASQTSVSNLISGLFLVAERPFSIGDVIRIGETTGEVLSIDMLSIKIRTFDNLFVRIPNETLIKSEVTTLTRFPIRRLDMQIGVAYKEDIDHVKRVLTEVAEKNPLCLEEPKPLYIFQGFGDSAMNLQFSVWATRENFLELKNSMHERVKSAFDQQGIEIPFPHRSIYAGSMTEPFPVKVVAESKPD